MSKAIGFASQCDMISSKTCATFSTNQNKTKTLTVTFPHFVSGTRNYFEFWLVHCSVFVFRWIGYSWFATLNWNLHFVNTDWYITFFSWKLLYWSSPVKCRRRCRQWFSWMAQVGRCRCYAPWIPSGCHSEWSRIAALVLLPASGVESDQHYISPNKIIK